MKLLLLFVLAVGAFSYEKPVITLRMGSQLIENIDAVAAAPMGLNSHQQDDFNKQYKSKSDHVFNCEYQRPQACEMPVASAHDHHDESVAIAMTYQIIDNVKGTTSTSSSGSDKVVCDKTMVHKTQIFKYDATDYSGNKAEQITVAFFIWDSVAPYITLCPNDNVIEAVNAGYRDAHYSPYTYPKNFNGCRSNSKTTAHDDVDGDLTASMTTTITHNGQGGFDQSGVDFAACGKWEIKYAVQDLSENPTSNTKVITVQDTKKPVIHVTGKDVVMECSHKYSDAGAVCTDMLDGDITSDAKKFSTSNPVDTMKKQAFTVAYSCKDGHDHMAVSKTRQVTIQDTTKPEIKLNGQDTIQLWAGATVWQPHPSHSHTQDAGKAANNYEQSYDLGTSCSDACSNYATSTANSFAPAFNGLKPGTYKETYTCTDGAGLTDSVIREIVIVDKRNPLILMNGNNPQVLEAAPGLTYKDAGATCTDEVDGDLSTSVVVKGNNVNGEKPATYKITYDCSDASGNSAAQLTRTVIVKDTTIPTLYMNSKKFMVIEASFPFTDPGCTAFDSLDGDITADITSNAGDVDPFKKNGAHVASHHPGDLGFDKANTNGVYHINYNVNDAHNNAAVSLKRTVVVKDTLPPVITLKHGGSTYGHAAQKYDEYPFDGAYDDSNYNYLARNNLGKAADTGISGFSPQGGYLALNEQKSSNNNVAVIAGLALAATGIALFTLKKRQNNAKTFVMV